MGKDGGQDRLASLLAGLPEAPVPLAVGCVREKETDGGQERPVPRANIRNGICRQNCFDEKRVLAQTGDRKGSLSRRVLTVCVFFFTEEPQVQQGCTLLQQGVGVFHADSVDVFHAEPQLPGQLCRQRTEARGEPYSSSQAGHHGLGAS